MSGHISRFILTHLFTKVKKLYKMECFSFSSFLLFLSLFNNYFNTHSFCPAPHPWFPLANFFSFCPLSGYSMFRDAVLIAIGFSLLWHGIWFHCKVCAVSYAWAGSWKQKRRVYSNVLFIIYVLREKNIIRYHSR